MPKGRENANTKLYADYGFIVREYAYLWCFGIILV